MATEKGPEAFRTISEVAADLELPHHVLRFWETKFSQIRPLKRGGGRRLYRPQDLDLLRGIRQLLYGDGFTIKGVQKILRDHGVPYVMAVGRGEAVAVDPPPDIETREYPAISDPQASLPFSGAGDQDADDTVPVPPDARGAPGAGLAEGVRMGGPGRGRRETGEGSATERQLRQILSDLMACKKRLDEAR